MVILIELCFFSQQCTLKLNQITLFSFRCSQFLRRGFRAALDALNDDSKHGKVVKKFEKGWKLEAKREKREMGEEAKMVMKESYSFITAKLRIKANKTKNSN